jgi:hypothetical protein
MSSYAHIKIIGNRCRRNNYTRIVFRCREWQHMFLSVGFDLYLAIKREKKRRYPALPSESHVMLGYKTWTGVFRWFWSFSVLPLLGGFLNIASPESKQLHCVAFMRVKPDSALGLRLSIRVLFRSSPATEHSPRLRKPRVYPETLVNNRIVVIDNIFWICLHEPSRRYLFRSFSTTEHLPCLSSRQLRSRW